MPRIPKHTLTIYLLKDSFADPDLALRNRSALSSHDIKVSGRVIGRLFAKGSFPRRPKWCSLFDGSVEPELPSNFFNSTTSAVFITESLGKTFAITFGQGGRHLMVSSAWEERFGLITTLNSVPPDELKSIDAQTFDAISSHKRTQASKAGNVHDFGFDIEQDLLRAATGAPTDTSLGSRMDGMDALHVTAPVTKETLSDLLGKYLDKYRETTYKTNFPWIDQIAEVRDAARVSHLDNILVERLNSQSPNDRLWLAVPEIIEWRNVRGFRYEQSEEDESYSDLQVQDFLASLGNTPQVTLEVLKSQNVEALHTTGDAVVEHWPVYKCVYAEVDDRGKTFLLSAGKWYSVDHDFAVGVGAAINNIVATTTDLPPYNDTSEEGYNARVSRENSRYALMDQKFISFGGGRSKFELCDLFKNDRKLVHVKRYGGSSVLSHLFSQGEMSAELLVAEPVFRDKARVLLPSSHQHLIPSSRPATDTFEVVFAIVFRGSGDLATTLPFFSRLNLRNRTRTLQGLGFKVSLVKIDVVTPTASVPA